jgi:integrase
MRARLVKGKSRLSAELMKVLTRLRSEADNGQVYVFVNTKSPAQDGRMKSKNVWRDFEAFRIKSGVPICSLQDLRKSCCTNMAGVLPMHVVQELAGHRDIRTLRQYYLKIPPKFFEDAPKSVDAIIRV